MPEDLIHIPMVWAGPGVKARKNKEDFVSTADIMPTLCEALGVALPHGSQGRSLWRMLRGAKYPAEEFQSIYSEVGFGGMYYESSDRVPYSVGKVAPPGAKVTFDELNPVTQSGNLKMLRKGHWKLLYDMMGNGELYDLSKDPYELTNLFEQPESAAQASKSAGPFGAYARRRSRHRQGFRLCHGTRRQHVHGESGGSGAWA